MTQSFVATGQTFMTADQDDRLIVTIDGPAGTGKSSVARRLARVLGLEFLDTGSMYRAAAALALDRQISLDEEITIAGLVADANLHFIWNVDPPQLHAFGQSIMGRIRDEDVTKSVSAVAGLRHVRAQMVDSQRRIGENHPRLVTEGRDQGSVVFPDALVKFYLDATPRVRAKRRAEQLIEAGRDADIDAIEREIIARDEQDSTRAIAPLVCPDDAISIDTTNKTLDEVVDELAEIVRERAGANLDAMTGRRD
ncbi:MAG: (d)CMP kinase [Planctomycetota bacterium]